MDSERFLSKLFYASFLQQKQPLDSAFYELDSVARSRSSNYNRIQPSYMPVSRAYVRVLLSIDMTVSAFSLASLK